MTDEMPRSDRIRRSVLLCHHFMRNYCYYSQMKKLNSRDSEFWKTVHGNFLDIAVLEWCKLFADKKDKHSWYKIVKNKREFEESMLETINLNATDFKTYVDEFLTYRDKFVAHLDSNRVMNIPKLKTARKCVMHYFDYLKDSERSTVDWSRISDLSGYLDRCKEEADLELPKSFNSKV